MNSFLALFCVQSTNCTYNYLKSYAVLMRKLIGTSSQRNGYVTGLPCSRPWFMSRTRQLKTHARHVCVRAQNPKRRTEEKGLRCGHTPWGVISYFLFFCLSHDYSHPVANTSLLKNKFKKHNAQHDIRIVLFYLELVLAVSSTPTLEFWMLNFSPLINYTKLFKTFPTTLPLSLFIYYWPYL